MATAWRVLRRAAPIPTTRTPRSTPAPPEICGDGRDQDCDGRDAQLGLDAICEAGPTTDPLFEQFRYDSKLRKTLPAASSSCAG